MHKFQWSEGEIGLALAAVGLSSAVVSGTLVGPIVKRLGEAGAAYAGLLLAAAGFFLSGFATQGWMLFPAIGLGAFMGLVMPSLRSIMSQSVGEDAQGELQGAVGSVMGLTAIVAPLLMTQVFSYFSAADAVVYFPGASFLLAGTLMLIALAVVFAILSKQDSAAAD